MNLSAFPGPEKLRAKIRVTGFTPPGLAAPCWDWTGAHDSRGYARVKVAGKSGYVRRLILDLVPSTLKRNHFIISLCRRPGCVNPDHHLIGKKNEVRAFGRWGHLCVGSLWQARQLIEAGEMTSGALARCWRISESLLAEGIKRCSRCS